MISEAAIGQIAFDAQGLVPAIAQDADSGRVLMVAWMNREALQRTVDTGQAVYWSRSRARLWPKGEESGHRQQVLSIHLDCDGDVLLLRVRQQGGIACHTGRESCFFRRLDEASGAWQITDAPLKDPALIYRAGESAPAAVADAAAAGAAAARSAADSGAVLERLAAIVEQRRDHGDAQTSYVARLFAKGEDAILKKIGEEATEFVMAAKDAGAVARHAAAGGVDGAAAAGTGDAAAAPVAQARDKLRNEAADLCFHWLIALAHYGLRPADVLAELARREGMSGLEEKALRKLAAREAGTD
ncbi:MAG: bifunctional phosphoribosyl-AMP cyclohydrolase/phosphoribosyl-ATP diphosphatase HisIE [Burkholderiaceae bacterium]|nr:bifunctional phosphoribosyl-AMP cyclohydrolase/phosphoribosyl-ATP diphosphatase HisIE [Burkholderiaceae bacterium]